MRHSRRDIGIVPLFAGVAQMTNSKPIAPVTVSDPSAGKDPENDYDVAIAIFARTKGITRCPTACLLPTQGYISLADRLALRAHAAGRDQVRRADAIAPARSKFGPISLTFATIAREIEGEVSFCDDSRDPLYSERRRTKLQCDRANLDDESEQTLSQQSPEFFSLIIERARKLEAEATTVAVKRYLRQRITKYEILSEQASRGNGAGDFGSRPRYRRNHLR
jgi:hypothetical protein